MPLGRICRFVFALLSLGAALAQAQPAFQVVKVFDLQATNPYGNLLQAADGKFYGTTKYGGQNNQGTVYRLNLDGSGYTILHQFYFGTDGNGPIAGLIQATNGKLYGTCYANGVNGWGTLWSMNTDGTGFTVLHSFASGAADAGEPNSTLVQATDGRIYGATYSGGANGMGAAFRVNLDGSGYQVLRLFTSLTDGDRPAGLIQGTDGVLYGTCYSGGTSDGGTLWRMNADGTGFALVHTFLGLSDGAYLMAPPIQGADGRLYGSTSYAGPQVNGIGFGNGVYNGTVFGVDTNGANFATLYGFNSGNLDGSPTAGLFQASDGFLYGTTQSGPLLGTGVLFRLTTSGATFQVLRTFALQTDGGNPNGPLMQASDGNLYGTLTNGGANNQFQSPGTLYGLFYVTVPTVTSGANLSGTSGTPFSYTITGTFAPTTFGVTGALPTGLTFTPGTGVITGTPVQTGTFPLTLSATNSSGTGTLPATLTIAAPLLAAQTIAFPAIPNQSLGSGAVVLGATATSGLPVTYVVTSGPATVAGGMLTLTGVGTVSVTASQVGNASYAAAAPVTHTFQVSAATATVTLSHLAQPYDGTAKSVTVVTSPPGLSVSVTYNGSVAAPFAIGSYTVIAAVTSQGYSGNGVGTLTISAVAPVLVQQPASQTVTAGTDVTFTAGATAAPSATYQWYRNGVAVAGATGFQLLLPAVTVGQAGTYTVAASNVAGTAVSPGAVLTVNPALIQGAYFGKYLLQLIASSTGAAPRAAASGTMAFYLRADGTGTLLVYLPVSQTGYLAPIVTDADGNFTATAAPLTGAGAAWTCHGRIVNGVLNATIDGQSATLTATADAAAGPAGSGFFVAQSLGTGGGDTYVVTGGDGTAFALVTNGASVDGGTGTLGAGGTLAVTTSQGAQLAGTISASGQISLQESGGTGAPASNYYGVSAAVAASVTLVDGSARAAVGAGEDGLITGFVLAGSGQKQVLVRAAGPALTAFGVPGVLAAPIVTVYQGGTVLASNQGWATAANASGVAGAAAAVGAFAFAPASADSAVMLTLAPGAYTAVVSGAGGGTGVALAEIYDVSKDATHLANFSSRGFVGSSAQNLIAGVVVSGNTAKKLLIRAAGPGLKPFGISTALAAPQLQIVQGSTVLAQNSGWADDPTLAAAAAGTGAFPLAAGSKDAALIITLAPGSYTAVVTGSGGSTGVALVEVYELP